MTGVPAPSSVDGVDGATLVPRAAKYHEGEVAALSEAMRLLASAGPVNGMPLLQQALTRWTHRANSLSASPTPAWRAYHEGGRDALEAFLDAERRDLRSH